jgi:putative sensor protein
MTTPRPPRPGPPSATSREGSGRAGWSPCPDPGEARLSLRRDPVRLVFSAAPWVCAGYLASYVIVGWVLFAAALTSVMVTAVLCVTLAGIPLLTATAFVLRGCANVERWRLRQVFNTPVRGGYQRVTRPGLFAHAAARWRDQATWRDLAYLIGLWVPLFVLSVTVLAIWLVLLAGIALPAWYWAPPQTFTEHGPVYHGVALGYFPHGPDGPGGGGIFVDSLPKALACAAGFAVLFLLFNYVLVAACRAHALVARAVLRAPSDWLAPVKEVLRRPGPLPPLAPAGPTPGQDGPQAPPG